MHNLLKKHFASNTTFDFEYTFNLMYSVYSLPNVILPLLGGVLIFKYGYRIMFLVFGFSILIGQLIFAIGCSTKSIPVMLIGRTVFGFGGESINTTLISVILQWFAPNEISFALGLCISCAKFGTVLNDVISPRIATVSFLFYFFILFFYINKVFRCLFGYVAWFCCVWIFVFMLDFACLFRLEAGYFNTNEGNCKFE